MSKSYGTLVNGWDRVSAWEGLLLMARSAAALVENHGRSGCFRNVSDQHYYG